MPRGLPAGLRRSMPRSPAVMRSSLFAPACSSRRLQPSPAWSVSQACIQPALASNSQQVEPRAHETVHQPGHGRSSRSFHSHSVHGLRPFSHKICLEGVALATASYSELRASCGALSRASSAERRSSSSATRTLPSSASASLLRSNTVYKKGCP